MGSLEGGLRRRGVLAGAGTAITMALAGCPGDDTDEEPRSTASPALEGHPEPEQQLPTPVAGDPDADVTVAAYEDLGCSYCRTYTLDTEPQVWEAYVDPGRIRYEWHDWPVPVDEDQSWLAADAARSVQANADSIDAFWAFVELVYENLDDLSLDLYETLANEVGVDGATVRQETEDRTYEPTVVASRIAGSERNVRAVPTIFANDDRMEAPSYDVLRNAIDDQLESTDG